MKNVIEWKDEFGFQIAPMIDVVFVIMLFFMVMAGAVQRENELPTQLPGNAETSASTDFADEQVVLIQEDGQVFLNEEPFDTPTDTDLPKFRLTLQRLKATCDQAKSACLVTVNSEPAARYHRIVDVLDALAVAKIVNVTFTVAEEP